jgi:hypothetical protein
MTLMRWETSDSPAEFSRYDPRGRRTSPVF